MFHQNIIYDLYCFVITGSSSSEDDVIFTEIDVHMPVNNDVNSSSLTNIELLDNGVSPNKITTERTPDILDSSAVKSVNSQKDFTNQSKSILGIRKFTSISLFMLFY